MECEGLLPDAVTFICALKACASAKDLDRGRRIHNEIGRRDLLVKDAALGNALVDMYAKCGAFLTAQEVLEELPLRDVVSWSALISGYAQQGQGHLALKCFGQMRAEGLSPNVVTFLCLLKACASIRKLDEGEHIQDEILKQGLLKDNRLLGTALVDMYAKCGALARARQIHDELPIRDVVSWSALISGYAEHGQGQDALDCFENMKQDGFAPNSVTFMSVLKACASLEASDKGEQFHYEIMRQGWLQKDIAVGNAVVDMYAKCGALVKARQVLEELPSRNSVSWNSLIAGYVQQSQNKEAIRCFEEMQSERLSPDEVTFVCILNACGELQNIDKGKEIHHEIVRQGLLGTNIEIDIAVVNMYSKCGRLEIAQEVLDDLVKDAVVWSTLVARYVQQDKADAALNCFDLMEQKGLSPDEMTFIHILKACGCLRMVEKGIQIHGEVVRQGLLDKNVALCTTLIDMYTKCGVLSRAKDVLDELPVSCVTAWSALIGGYAEQGQCHDALTCFDQMHSKGLMPDAITFSCLLNACSHSGRLDEGQICFQIMRMKYGIEPSVEHYTCMVDLYGRAGHFDKAIAVIESMPSSDHLFVWSALLGACQKWGEANVGRWAFEHAIQLDKDDDAAYICMANIYVTIGMQEEAASITALQVKNKASRKQNCMEQSCG
ncbi:hypothetical protein KP509_07G042200 [Ceratopteris richardii]|nr:hypothetical protein KP509_07G042200 [Ceratopteris richardii]